MGQSASQKLKDNAQELKKLNAEANEQIALFQAEIEPKVKGQQMVDSNHDIKVTTQDSKKIPEQVNGLLQQQSWGAAGQYAKKNITAVVQSLLSSSTGSLSVKKGYNLITTRGGALSRLVWMIYSKTVSGSAFGETKNQTIFVYYYATYIVDKAQTSVMAIKSLLLGSSLKEEDRKEAEAALMCDMMGICSADQMRENEKREKKQREAQLKNLAKELTLQGKYAEAASVLDILKKMQQLN